MDNRNNRTLTERDVSAIMSRYDVKHTCLDAGTYRRAMRHATMREDTNERLEFLGDSVIALVVTQYCHKRYADQTEAFLTRLRMLLVAGDTLSRLSVEVGLPSWLMLPFKSESMRSRSNVQEDLLEAFVGAIFLEQGFDSARDWFVNVMEAHLDVSEYIQKLYCSKDRLLRYCRSKWGTVPVISVDDAGTDNVFNAKVYHCDQLVAEAMATTRREAEVKACLAAWNVLTVKEAS